MVGALEFIGIDGGSVWEQSKDRRRISDELWTRRGPYLPVHVPIKHPMDRPCKRVDDRKVMDGIPFVMRTGCQWRALDATGSCSGANAHARFQEWTKGGVFQRL